VVRLINTCASLFALNGAWLHSDIGTVDIYRFICIYRYLKKEEVAGGWRRLHNEELHNLYALLSIIRVIRTRRMRLAGHVACMGETRKMRMYPEVSGLSR
jgi:hypothetical protein